MGGGVVSKSLFQFSVDEQGCVPSLLFGLKPNYGRDNGDLLHKGLCQHFCIQYPDLAAGHCQPTPLPKIPGHSQASLVQSLVESLILSPGSWCTRFCLCPPRVCFPLLGKFCNQTPLASKVKFCGSSRSFCQIPRLGNLLWVLEISQQCENSSGIIVLQFVGHLLSGSMVGLMVTSSKRT